MPDKPTEESYLPITDGILYKGCPDNPTDNKLTFVEFVAKESFGKDIKGIEIALKLALDNIIDFGKHYKDCTSKNNPCTLCSLESMLQEYYKYFKENN